MQQYNVIGIMSGTSLDGVDLAYCTFQFNTHWTYAILKAETFSYSEEWKKILTELPTKNAETFVKVDSALGKLFGQLVKDFCTKHSLDPDFISSHGHTIFHQPDSGYTSQIGDGSSISAVSGFPVICDFRSADVALGGQGAPLVPIGDRLLFGEFDYCLNLGGIANISFEENNQRIAFDVCGCNIVLNALACRLGDEYDEGGKYAAKGTINNELLDKINKSGYFNKPYPKSLGREDLEVDILPIFDKPGMKVEDLLATFCEHIAQQIGKQTKSGNMIVSGGGVHNSFLLDRIKFYSKASIVVPDVQIINFKEALIFAFLGVLRKRKEVNCLSSVTGSSRDNCGGIIWEP